MEEFGSRQTGMRWTRPSKAAHKVDICDEFNLTPLHFAALGNKLEVAALLLDGSEDIEAL